MLRTKLQDAGQIVFDRLIEAERSTDIALAATAELVAELLRAKLSLRLSSVTTAQAIDASGRTFAQQLAGRQEIVGLHHHLADLKSESALRSLSFGGSDYKGSLADLPTETPGLAIVAEREAA